MGGVLSYSLRLCELGNWTLQSPHALILLPNGFSHAIILQHPPTSSTPAPSPKQGSCPAAPLPQEVVKTVDPRLCCCAPADAPKCRYVTDCMWVLACAKPHWRPGNGQMSIQKHRQINCQTRAARIWTSARGGCQAGAPHLQAAF